MNHRAEVLLGTTLESRYRLDAVITETPDLFVFSGEDTTTNEPITIRMPRAPRGMSMAELAEAYDKFALEAEQLKQLSLASSYVEQLLASGEVESPDRERLAYCVFARTDGSSLAAVGAAQQGALPLTHAVRMLDSIASALGTAHAQGAWHGDVRPENMIVVREDGDERLVKLVRFTLATRLGTGARTFAPQYGAPEHFKKSFGESSVGPPADTYGLALCLVELVTGSPALVGSTTTEFYKQTTDITRRPTLLGRGMTDVSPAIDAVIARAVAVNPKLRWPSAEDFWHALKALPGVVSISSMPATAAGVSRLDAPTMPADFPITPLSSLVSAAAGGSRAGEDAQPPSSSLLLEPTLAIPPPPGSQPNVVAPPPPPARVPQSLKPPAPRNPSPLAARQSSPSSSSHADAPPILRRLDEGAIDSHPPQGRSVSVRMIAIACVAVVMLMIGVAIIVSVVGRSTPRAAPAPSASSSVVPAESIVSPPSPPTHESPSPAPVPSGMIRVEPGTFTMGKDSEGKGDRPAHKVKLTHAYYIDKLEVTAEAYQGCIDAGACTPRIVHVKKQLSGLWGCNIEKERGAHPANCIDRKQAAAYCAYAKKRLLTEAEWEYAARGADERDYPWGATAPTTCTTAVLSGMTGGCGDRKGTSAVGSAPDGASALGALDMGGNVWEWVADDYAPYPADEVTDPQVTSSSEADASPPPRGILRGGSWDYGPQSAKTTYRLPFVAEAGNASIGVRCGMTP